MYTSLTFHVHTMPVYLSCGLNFLYRLSCTLDTCKETRIRVGGVRSSLAPVHNSFLFLVGNGRWWRTGAVSAIWISIPSSLFSDKFTWTADLAASSAPPVVSVQNQEAMKTLVDEIVPCCLDKRVIHYDVDEIRNPDDQPNENLVHVSLQRR